MMKASKVIALRRVLNSLNCLDVSTRPGGGALEGEQLFLCPVPNDMLHPAYISVTNTEN
jgi:hypothetical protein